MNGRYLLDTNIVIVSFRGESGVVDRIDDADEYFVSSTILGELFYGAFNSTNVNDNIGRIESFLAQSGLLSCDAVTSQIYGEIKTELRREGRPIPDNDIWIAASAKQHSLTSVRQPKTRNRFPQTTRVDLR